MAWLWRHISRCLVAGIVALLPIGGLALSIVYLEYTLARVWLRNQDFYIPGLGIVITLLAVYLIGLIVSTFLGQLLWKQVDRLLKHMPVLGGLYTTLQQILGYGEGPGALFERVVLVPGREQNCWEIGLVTGMKQDQLLVFVPAAPNPLTGRLIIIAAVETRPTALTVNEAMRTLVAVGKSDGERLLATP